jgi:uncharacterized protein
MRIIHRYTELIMKRPVLTLVILALITVALGSGLRKLQFDTSVETFLPSDDPQYIFYRTVKQTYGDIDTFVIFAVSQKNLWNQETFAEIDNFLTDIEEFQHNDKAREENRIEKLSAWLNKDSVRLDDLKKDFSDDPGFVRFIERKLKTFSASETQTITPAALNFVYKEELRLKPLKEMKIIHKVISPFTIKDIIGTEDTLRTVELIAKDKNGKRILPKTQEEFETFKTRLLRNPIFDKGIYSMDRATGEITDLAFVIRFSTDSSISKQDAVSRELLNVVDGYKDLNIIAQGQPLIYAWINDYIRKDLLNLVPLSLLVVTIILFINFRTFRGVFLPFTTLVMSMVWVLGLMGHLGVKITQLCTSLPPLIICVGSAYAIHVLNQYYEDLESIKQKGIQNGLLPSMSHINLTVALAGITTIISFWTLANHQIPGLRVWGLFTGLGVMFAVIIAMTLIPPCLCLIPHKNHFLPGKKKVEGAHIDLVAVLIKWLTNASLNHSGKVLVAISIIVAFSIVGIFKLRVETELLQYFKADNPIRVSEKYIGEKFGGRWGFNILIDSGVPDGVKHADYLNTLESLRAWLESDENKFLNVGRTDGFPDYIRTMNMAMNNDNREFFTIPQNDMDIADYLEIYADDDENSDGRADSFEAYVDPKFQTCNLLTRLCQRQGHLVGTGELKNIFEKIKQHLAETLPKNYSFAISGHPVLFIQSADYISGGQLQSLFQSMAVISFVIFFLLRNLSAGFLALIPLGLAVTLNFGLMGWLGIPLDVATSVIAAITIGIGDDVTIHFINTWRHLRQAGYSVEDSIKETLLESGRANIYSALALIFGCSVFIVSTFKPIVLFGILMVVVIAANNIGALLILPSVIKLIRFDIIPVEKPS